MVFSKMPRFLHPPRVILCDVYGTLLRIYPEPRDADDKWAAVGLAAGISNLPTLDAIDAMAKTIIAADHIRQKVQGIDFPEVNWPEILVQTVRQLGGGMSGVSGADLSLAHARIVRTCQPMAGAREALREWSGKFSLGILSNAQAYTCHEMADAGISLDVFAPTMLFWSYEQGMAKPSPTLFRRVTTQLAEHGLSPQDILMVGDSEENDIVPARLVDWQTWHFRQVIGSDWRALRRVLAKPQDYRVTPR